MDAARQMDRMYRYQRHIYDLTRKYYLLGRDRLIATLDAGPGETFCEVGCGTGRNLVKAARRYPASHWYGVDPSAAMLRSAEANLRRARLHARVTLAPAEAATLDPAAHLDLAEPLDGVWFSYALSMIPDWRPAVDHALAITGPSGRIHAVDFGDLEGLPPGFRRLLTAWLARFGVHRKPEIAAYFRELAGRGYGQVEIQPLYRGYAELIHFEKV
jgi:S-adenosylmethionine-diacylgycerolhomoserine-N-methlytransferase